MVTRIIKIEYFMKEYKEKINNAKPKKRKV